MLIACEVVASDHFDQFVGGTFCDGRPCSSRSCCVYPPGSHSWSCLVEVTSAMLGAHLSCSVLVHASIACFQPGCWCLDHWAFAFIGSLYWTIGVIWISEGLRLRSECLHRLACAHSPTWPYSSAADACPPCELLAPFCPDQLQLWFADSHVAANLSQAFEQCWHSPQGPVSCIPFFVAVFSFFGSESSTYSILERSWGQLLLSVGADLDGHRDLIGIWLSAGNHRLHH